MNKFRDTSEYLYIFNSANLALHHAKYLDFVSLRRNTQNIWQILYDIAQFFRKFFSWIDILRPRNDSMLKGG